MCTLKLGSNRVHMFSWQVSSMSEYPAAVVRVCWPSPSSLEAFCLVASACLQVLGRVLQLMHAGSPMAGSILWMTAAPSYPDYDGFTIYLPPAPAGSSPPQHGQHGRQQQQQGQGHQGQDMEQQEAPRRGLAKALGRLSQKLLGRGSSREATVAATEAAAMVQQADLLKGATVRAILEHAAQVAELNRGLSPPTPS